jgi:hypothetical protein
MSINRQEVEDLLKEATDYPLALRIAARMWLGGISEQAFACWTDESDNYLHTATPLNLEIDSYLYQLDSGKIKMTPELRNVAKTRV